MLKRVDSRPKYSSRQVLWKDSVFRSSSQIVAVRHILMPKNDAGYNSCGIRLLRRFQITSLGTVRVYTAKQINKSKSGKKR
jgi:hypothetical protein